MLAAPRTFIKNSPVTSLTSAESLLGAVLAFLATHHVIGDTDVSATTQTVAPFVALLLPAVFGAAKWSLVTPFAKVKDMAERDGLVSDADFARLGALLDDKLGEWGFGEDIGAGSDIDNEPASDSVESDVQEVDVDEAEHVPEHSAPDGAGSKTLDSPGGMAAGTAAERN